MIKFFVLFALFATTNLSAQGHLFKISSDEANIVIESGLSNCEEFETFTDWKASYEGNDKNIFAHKWVYAEKSDVNQRSNPSLTLAIGCASPCGPCPQSENEARICSLCLAHETRVRSWGWRAKPQTDSEYVKLKKKLNN